MHLFLVSGFIVAAIIIFFMFRLDDIKIKRNKIAEEKRYKFMKYRLVGKIFIACIVFVVISNVVPYLIWIMSPKEVATIYRVEDRETVYELTDEGGTYYAGRGTLKGKAKYVFKIVAEHGMEEQIIDASKVELVEIAADEKPKYEKVVQYKRSRLMGKGIIIDAVNDMYCDIDLKPTVLKPDPKTPNIIPNIEGKSKEDLRGWKETYIKDWVKIYVPKGTLKEDFKLDSI